MLGNHHRLVQDLARHFLLNITQKAHQLLLWLHRAYLNLIGSFRVREFFFVILGFFLCQPRYFGLVAVSGNH